MSRADRWAVSYGRKRAADEVDRSLRERIAWCASYWRDLLKHEDRADYRERARLYRIALAAVRKAVRR